MSSPESGGAPRRSEPLAVEFMNTSYARRGERQEGIGTPEHLAAWLLDHAGQLGTELPPSAIESLSARDSDQFRALRDAARDVGQSLVDGQPPSASAVAVINDAAASAPHWPQLIIAEEGWTARERTASGAVEAVRAEVARAAISLFAGPESQLLQRCHGPGCVLFYVKKHPRQGWCSEACGTRARVSRHYYRHRGSSGQA